MKFNKSEDAPTQPNFADIPNEQKLIMSKNMVGHGTEKVEKIINDLTSASLKRVLRIVSHTHLADALLGRSINFQLNEKEQSLIDSIFALQETVFGHQALETEINEEKNANNQVKNSSALETVDMAVSIEENNNVE